MRFLLTPRAVLAMVCATMLQAHPATKELTQAAQSFLDSLSPEQRSRVSYAADAEERENWHYVPKSRNGLMLKDMTPPQKDKALALLRAGLSERGHLKAQTILSLEKVLFEMEKRDIRNAGLYTVTLFGTPGSPGLWGWRFEGHHLSVNFTLVGDAHVATTPSFFGANPGEVRSGEARGTRALAEEEDLGRALLASLTPDQRKVAIFAAEAPREIVTGNERRITLDRPVGLPLARMTPVQGEKLKELVKLYVFRHRTDVAEGDLRKIDEGGWDRVHFGWAGGERPGQGHYYRVQGPTFLIEYDNVQNNANHVHTVWRDPEGDFGRDLLAEHYARDHRPAK